MAASPPPLVLADGGTLGPDVASGFRSAVASFPAAPDPGGVSP
jgi:hypothetical protein